ncbi:unnamed protein product [Cylicostephanus goldi]|uniref:BTB domain-containing protein n=1 Tax=Cylicostephanus goldi TaxID=71465 RepID=A0A3P6RPW2_CYLGO|nr:unnamed protein product [Cylicostephanus goldi]
MLHRLQHHRKHTFVSCSFHETSAKTCFLMLNKFMNLISKEKPYEPAVFLLEECFNCFETLFLGEGSDVTVHALGHVWHLHKLYLQQCKYFEVRFQCLYENLDFEDVLYLNFPDENVTQEGLHAVLGSLYHNQIELDLDNAEGVLSAASVLQLESVLERCGDAMAENLSVDNALRYLNLAEMYGLPQLIPNLDSISVTPFPGRSYKVQCSALASILRHILKDSCSKTLIFVSGKYEHPLKTFTLNILLVLHFQVGFQSSSWVRNLVTSHNQPHSA